MTGHVILTRGNNWYNTMWYVGWWPGAMYGGWCELVPFLNGIELHWPFAWFWVVEHRYTQRGTLQYGLVCGDVGHCWWPEDCKVGQYELEITTIYIITMQMDNKSYNTNPEHDIVTRAPYYYWVWQDPSISNLYWPILWSSGRQQWLTSLCIGSCCSVSCCVYWCFATWNHANGRCNSVPFTNGAGLYQPLCMAFGRQLTYHIVLLWVIHKWRHQLRGGRGFANDDGWWRGREGVQLLMTSSLIMRFLGKILNFSFFQ